MDFLLWIEESWMGIFIRESLWGYPIVLSSHGVGMAIVVGCVVAANMRVLGFAKDLSMQAYDRIFTVGWLGFLINLISGLILLTGNASQYFFQGSFQLKIAFILVGGILMKVMMNGIREHRDLIVTRIISFLCLTSWFGALITGRLMAYL